MDAPIPRHPAGDPARSFDLVADAYDRARPSYPDEAVAWLLEELSPPRRPVRVVELGAGTGKLTEQLVAGGCEVTAVDSSSAMLSRLTLRAPAAGPALGLAEELPVASRRADLVVAAQSFHRFDPSRAVSEAARVLRPGGRLAAVWNRRDDRVPWVRRLDRILGAGARDEEPADRFGREVAESGGFGPVERADFRFWQPTTRALLADLVRSRQEVAAMPDRERARVLGDVDALYDEYGRGADGMLLPYVTTACRATVSSGSVAAGDSADDDRGTLTADPDQAWADDDHALLIDFR